MIDSDALSAMRKLVLGIAPELRQSPLYIVTPPPDYPVMTGIRAFHTPYDFAIRADLVSRNEWRGKGNIICICADDIDTEDMLGVILHETAHALPFCEPAVDFEPTPAEAARQSELITAWVTTPDTAELREPWVRHELPFIRRCLHLAYRASRLGVVIPWPAIQFAGWHYGLSGAWRYSRLLGDEPARLSGCSFAEIEQTEAPPAFCELFNSDVAAWHRSDAYRSQAKMEHENA